MNILQKTIAVIDKWQRRHPATAFPYAVIKKYGEDEAGYQAALLTYYGFLSLFPLLLVVTTLVTMLGTSQLGLQHTVTSAIASYFPSFGDQLSKVQSIHKSGVALIVGILFTLYGARGVADAFRNGVNHIWQTPRAERVGFPLSILKNLAIIGVGGIGFLLASITSGIAAAAGQGFVFRALSIAINILILFWLFRLLLNLALPGHVPFRQTRSAAAAAAIGLVALQFAGNLVLTRQLKHLNAVYSIFALSLGLLFWIYLQAQTIYYAVEIASVRSLRLYPRGMQESDLTAADKRVMSRQARRERQIDSEIIDTRFS
ncbi:MAG: YhjD/YihY/BrkB family envelope integrity protein [Patescibacteria group bacterium]|nr:YhjD/YihY/BrkB family envelope integrity protein [Patescibacteria group bacterium]